MHDQPEPGEETPDDQAPASEPSSTEEMPPPAPIYGTRTEESAQGTTQKGLMDRLRSFFGGK
jgi:hypothetical protein